jgi:hypothetical protein
MSFIDNIVSWFYYIRILLSPLLLGTVLGAVLLIVVFKWSIYGWIFGCVSVVAGLILGIRLAEHARRKMGTLNFIAMNMHTKEFDDTRKD